MPDRRHFIHSSAATLLAASSAIRAQGSRTYTLGVLRPGDRPESGDPLASEALLSQALAARGYVEGRNLVIDARYAGGDAARLAPLATELVAKKVDAILAVAPPAVAAARRATSTLPIVMWGNFDPVAAGFVQSLSSPGHNVTGVLIAPDGTLAGKKLEVLREAVPRARQIAVLAPEDPSSLQIQLPELRKAARTLGVDLGVVTVVNRNYAEAFGKIMAARSDALFTLANSYFVRDRKPIIELANRHRLPSMWEWREQAAEGGLMAYGASLAARMRVIADHIHRIFGGARPGDIPVDQPTGVQLFINARTARSIGLPVPRPLLLRADEVIQ